MADFVLAIATTKTAYDAFLTARAVTVAALATLNALTAPVKPTVALLDATWSTYTGLLATYVAAVASATTALKTASDAQRVTELAVIATFGYGGNYTAGTTCMDEWVKVVGAGAGILTYTNYIGAATNSTYLVISTSLPAQAFPNV